MQIRRLSFNRSFPYVTYALIGVNVALFLVEGAMHLMGYSHGEILLRLGAKHNLLITFGQYWRLLTACFLHSGVMHLMSNLIGLYFWGPQIELLLGRGRYLAVYLFSGLMGSLLSFVCSDSMSVGASGALFGLFGALLYFRSRHKQVFNQVFGLQVLVIIGLNLANGFLDGGIDNFGHIGGLIGGYLSSYALGLFHERPGIRQWLCGAAALLAAAGLFVFGVTKYSALFGLPPFTFLDIPIA